MSKNDFKVLDLYMKRKWVREISFRFLVRKDNGLGLESLDLLVWRGIYI